MKKSNLDIMRRAKANEQRILYVLSTNDNQFWSVRDFRRNYSMEVNETRGAVRRLREYGVPILNRGYVYGPYYIPLPNQEKFVQEDVAHRRRMAQSWDNMTDIMEAAAYTRLKVHELVGQNLVKLFQ